MSKDLINLQVLRQMYTERRVRISMRSLRHLYPVILIILVLMLSIFTGCNSNDPVASNNNPPEEPTPLGSLGVFADQYGSSCNLQAPGGQVTYYVVHMGMDGATASEFKVEVPSGMTYSYNSSPFELVIGNDPTVDGVSIAYGACLASPVYVMALHFTSATPMPACTPIRIVAHPVADAIGAVDCSQNTLPVIGDVTYINSDGSCPCFQSQTPQGGEWQKIRGRFGN
jgi:hypothetical protein